MVQAIIAELKERKNETSTSLETVYFGGGTPSILDDDEFTELFTAIRTTYDVLPNAEVTVEANPDDLSKERLELLKQLGVNRLSIGIQSFFDHHLEWMNRAHDRKEGLTCIQEAQDLGFDNITIDLIYGIPIMTDEEWEANISQALALNVPHISAYNLTVEDKTVLHHMVAKGKSKDVNDEQGEQNFAVLKEQLLANDFVQYEISNFGKEGYFSQHNTSYWQEKKYLGIGPGAHSYDGKKRRWNVSNNQQYIKKIREGEDYFEDEILSPKDRVNEHLMIGLRNQWGCDWEYLTSTGIDLTQLKTEVVSKLNTGQLERTANGFKTSAQGLLFADAIAADLFVE
jgi:oxygen-independent coproporphyrinogen-3 oxidase